MRCWHREGFTRASSSWFGRWGPWGPAWNRGRPTQSVVSSERQVWPGRRSLYIRRVNSDGYEAPATARSPRLVRITTRPRFPKRPSRRRRYGHCGPGARGYAYFPERSVFADRAVRSVASPRPAPRGPRPLGETQLTGPVASAGRRAFPFGVIIHRGTTGCHAREAEFEKNLSYSQDTTLNSNANRYASSPGRSSTASLRAITDQGSQYSNTQCSQHTSSQARMAPERYVWCSRA